MRKNLGGKDKLGVRVNTLGEWERRWSGDEAERK